MWFKHGLILRTITFLDLSVADDEATADGWLVIHISLVSERSLQNNTHAINFTVAPLLAGQEDTDISSLLETAETRCSNKSELGGKSEMEEKRALRAEGSSPAAHVGAHARPLVTLHGGDFKTLLCFFTGQLEDEL